MIENKHIKIVEYPPAAWKKTRDFGVVNKKSNDHIAIISWYSPWRQYCLSTFEGNDTIFNSECLELVTPFLKRINTEHRKNWKQKKKDP